MNAATMAKATRIALAFVFLAAAPQKIAAPADFAASIASYLILPDVLINFTALLLPWLEIVVAFMLLCLVWTGMALFLANAMLVAFLAAIVSAYLRGIDISCGCFYIRCFSCAKKLRRCREYPRGKDYRTKR